uniref:Uncharacterized protein n=1 Tax=Candidatus Kentrum sp. TC TaxID=2126339 RepID=A0A450YN21_9GAMM|nr:MAG: hypothetical protein BECKTC1821E_GA0114239_102218 [Candidatus Kentron sp. TC]
MDVDLAGLFDNGTTDGEVAGVMLSPWRPVLPVYLVLKEGIRRNVLLRRKSGNERKYTEKKQQASNRPRAFTHGYVP